MRGWTRNQEQTVTVEVHGQVLDHMSFSDHEQAEGYKQAVRRWAREKGIIVGIWTRRLDPAHATVRAAIS
jgi:hypothetical protein